jgi:hypothetical protein
MGKKVFLEYAHAGASGVVQGTLERYDEETDTYVLVIERNMRPHPQTGELIILPKSETELFGEDVYSVQQQMETEDEARRAIEIAGAVAGGAGGGLGGLQ